MKTSQHPADVPTTVAIFTRGGNDRPRTIAEAARAIYDGFKALVTWPLGAPAFSR